MTAALAERLAAQLTPSPTWSEAETRAVEHTLAEVFGAHQRQGLAQPEDRFLAHLAARLPAAPIERALAGLDLDGLYLACACATGDRAALAAFEQRHAADIAHAVAHLDNTGDLRDEVAQRMRDKLFVGGPGLEPKIVRYSGHVPLARWLQVMATREAVALTRAAARETPLELHHLRIAGGDVALNHLKAEYRRELALAFSEAIATLSSRARNVLHYHFVKRLSIDQIGALYRVNRVTAFRWLRSARTDVVSATRKRMAARLSIDRSELESILRLIQSHLDLTFEALQEVVPDP